VISLEAVAYSSYCNTVEWFWWHLSLSQWPTNFLQCFDTVGWVIWPVKIVPEMTYKVSSGMLSLDTHFNSTILTLTTGYALQRCLELRSKSLVISITILCGIAIPTRGHRHLTKTAANDPVHMARNVHCVHCRRFEPCDRLTDRHGKHR